MALVVLDLISTHGLELGKYIRVEIEIVNSLFCKSKYLSYMDVVIVVSNAAK